MRERTQGWASRSLRADGHVANVGAEVAVGRTPSHSRHCGRPTAECSRTMPPVDGTAVAAVPGRRGAAACVGGLRVPWQAGSSDGRDSAVQTPSYDSCSLLRDNGVGALRVSSTLAVSSARVDHATCQRTCAPACNTPRFSHAHSLNSLLQFLPGPHKLPYPQCLPSAPLPP